MTERNFNVPEIKSTDAKEIADAVKRLIGDEGSKFADKLVTPGFKTELEKTKANVNFSVDIPADGKFINQANLAKIFHEQVSLQVDVALRELPTGEIDRALGETGINITDAAIFVAFSYAYYLLKMVQDDYDKLKDEDKKSLKSFNLKVDPKTGKVSVDFVKADGTILVPTSEPAKAPDAAPTEIGGLKLKGEKTIDDVQGYAEALGLTTKSSLDGNIPKDFNFDGEATKLVGKLRSLIDKNVALGKIDALRSIVQEDVNDSNVVEISAKLAAGYYVKKLEADFKKEYPEIAKVDWKDEKCKVSYSLEIREGLPAIKFDSTQEFKEAYGKAEKAEAEAARDPGDAETRQKMKDNPLIRLLTGMSPEGEAILDKVIEGKAAGLTGFLIAIVAGIYGIGKFESSWATIKSYAPESLKPVLAKIEATVEKGKAKLEELITKNNEDFVKLLSSVKGEYSVSEHGLRLKENFTPKSGGIAYLQVTLGEKQDVTFGGKIGKILKDGVEIDVVENKISDNGVYRIECEIPKNTAFSKGVKLKLVKTADIPVAAKPDAAKPAAVAQADKGPEVK